MAGTDDSSLEKAEGTVKRVLERLGAKVDQRLRAGKDSDLLTPQQIGDLISLMESSTKSSLRPDSKGVRRVAPNVFKVLLTYEHGARLPQTYKQELADALTSEIHEFIHNRRYETLGEVTVKVDADLFAKAASIKCGFGQDIVDPSAPKLAGPDAGPSSKDEARTVEIETSNGKLIRLNLSTEGGPAYIGRAAGIAVHLDDPGISRLHSSIAVRPNKEIIVSDLGSSNGTYVNGQVVNKGEAASLKTGDVISIAGVCLTVRVIK